jgi:phosphoglycerate dehydrogenase-like enzyme
VARRIPTGDGLVRSGEWRQFEGVELTGRRMGVVGAGPIGERMVALGRGIGMDVVAWTRNPSPERASRLGAPFVELDELFASSDVVSLHLVHTAATEKLVTRELLDRLGPTGILVNTARAELVDSEALAEALRDERIWGAGLDVFDQEPADPDSELVQSERTVVTPHVGYYTGPANDQLLARAIENLRAFADGQPTNVVS